MEIMPRVRLDNAQELTHPVCVFMLWPPRVAVCVTWPHMTSVHYACLVFNIGMFTKAAYYASTLLLGELIIFNFVWLGTA